MLKSNAPLRTRRKDSAGRVILLWFDNRDHQCNPIYSVIHAPDRREPARAGKPFDFEWSNDITDRHVGLANIS
jgi:hypothetical protein